MDLDIFTWYNATADGHAQKNFNSILFYFVYCVNAQFRSINQVYLKREDDQIKVFLFLFCFWTNYEFTHTHTHTHFKQAYYNRQNEPTFKVF